MRTFKPSGPHGAKAKPFVLVPQKRDPVKVACYARKSWLKNMGMDPNTTIPPKPEACPLCLQSRKLMLDHCHHSNTIRGWICGSCNSMLGFARDDPATLHRAIVYLSKKE